MAVIDTKSVFDSTSSPEQQYQAREKLTVPSLSQHKLNYDEYLAIGFHQMA